MRIRNTIKIAQSFVIGILLVAGLTVAVQAEQVNSRIIGGQNAEEGEWPFMVSLIYPDSEHVSDLTFCGGTLIHPRYVLTAAHCVAGEGGLPQQPESIQVLAGRTKLTSSAGKIIPVQEVIMHPGYDSFFAFYDVALLRLSHEVQGPFVELPGPAEEEKLLAQGVATVLGWGITAAFYPVLPNVLQEAEVPLQENEVCLDSIGLYFDPKYNICAGILSSGFDESDGVDTCNGDSGGPLLVSDDRKWFIMGITSWGFGCANEQAYGVYHRVAPVREWIDSTVDPISRIEGILTGFSDLLDSALTPSEDTEVCIGDYCFEETSPAEIASNQIRLNIQALGILVEEELTVTAAFPGLSARPITRLERLTERVFGRRGRKKKRQRILLRKINKLIKKLLPAGETR